VPLILLLWNEFFCSLLFCLQLGDPLYLFGCAYRHRTKSDHYSSVGAHLSQNTFALLGVTDVFENIHICDKLEMRRMCSTHNRKDTRSTFVSHSSIKCYLKRKLFLFRTLLFSEKADIEIVLGFLYFL
jgi:hypothetical protein